MIHKKSKSKYKNKQIRIDGYTWDSEKEYTRYRELKLLIKAGEIRDLEIKRKFEIIPSNKLFKAVHYESDFSYYDKECNFIVEDVKPTFKNKKSQKDYQKSEAYRMFDLKRRLMYTIYKIIIKEV